VGYLAGNKNTAICCSFKNIRSHHYYKAINYNDLGDVGGTKKKQCRSFHHMKVRREAKVS